MNSKDLCFSILRAESEAEVSAIIDAEHEMSDPSNWNPLDNRDTNFNVVNNQSSSASKALTELLTNASDAVIMKAASLAGIDPKTPASPQSPQQAVKLLFGSQLRGAALAGRLGDATDSDLLTFARENLLVGVTGESETSCFTIVDNGEGQKPKRFNDTFLSLSNKLKSDIPYVQGKYNMGSSGVLRYCGTKGYKLIVSRHHETMLPWGWTLIREKPDSRDYPIYESFSLQGTIPTFAHNDGIRPLSARNGQIDDEVLLATGTIVKIFNYRIEGQRDFIGIRNGIGQNMVSTTLPFRLLDYRYPRARRSGRAGFVDERTSLGLEAELTRSNAQMARRIRIREISDPILGTIVIDAILFDTIPEVLRGTTDRVFHHVNGQVQYKRKKGYLSQNLKLPGLVDNVAILIDASGLEGNAFYKVFSPDRERVMGTAENAHYTEIVDYALRQAEELKEWEQTKATEKVNEAAGKARDVTFQRLLRRAPEIQNLFGLGGDLILPTPQLESTPPYEGMHIPTFLRLGSASKVSQPIEIEIGERREIAFYTDANNDYLDRSDESGIAEIHIRFPSRRGRSLRFRRRLPSQRRRSQWRDKRRLRSSRPLVRTWKRLKDGRFFTGLQTLDDNAKPGQKLKLKARFIDKNLPSGELTDNAVIVLTEQRERVHRERKQIERPHLTMPENRWTTKDGRRVGGEDSSKWPEGFNEQDGGRVEALTADQSLYLINFDNVALQNAIDRLGKAQREQTIAMHRNGMLLAMMSMKKKFEDHIDTLDIEQQEAMRSLESEIHQVNAQAIAMVMPFLVRTLPLHFQQAQDEEE